MEKKCFIQVALPIILCLIFSVGCSDEADNSAAVQPGDASLRSNEMVGGLSVQFTYPENPGFGNYQSDDSRLNRGGKFTPLLVNSTAFFYYIEQRFPMSWEELSPYMPLLPRDFATSAMYNLLDYNATDGVAPADSIIAAWNEDGPVFFIPTETDEGLESLTVNRNDFIKIINLIQEVGSEERGTTPSSPEFRLGNQMQSLAVTIVSDYTYMNGRLPETVDEFLSSFAVNQAYNTAYTLDPNSNAGRFHMTVNPSNGKTIFHYSLPDGITASYPSVHGIRKSIPDDALIDPANEDMEEYITIFCEKDFFSRM